MLFRVLTAVLASQIGFAKALGPLNIGVAVNTSSGLVVGHAASNATQVSEYLGIPFAQPPVGDLRFAPPVAYQGNGTVKAFSFGADCPSLPADVPYFPDFRVQTLLDSLDQNKDNLDEDCLFLNVWTKPQSGSNRKPYFADTEDVVVVSFNYRVNVFGFPGASGITQNLGLLDQRLAVEWVRDNIAAFGGDSTRITLFGQSAGGASIDLYSYAWMQDPIIAGTILQSGTATSFGNRLASSGETAWYKVTSQLGCGNNDTTDPDTVLACMKGSNVTWQQIVNATNAGPGLASVLGDFGPTIDNVTVFNNYTELALAGSYIQKPTLTGSCNDEAGLFIILAAGAGVTLPQAAWDTFDLDTFTCPVATSARGMYPNLLLPTVNISQAYHTAELPVLFGTSQEASLTDSIWQERALGDYIRGAWAAFAAYPESGLETLYGWPKYDENNQTLISLGQNNETVASYGYPAAVDANRTFPFLGTANLLSIDAARVDSISLVTQGNDNAYLRA